MPDRQPRRPCPPPPMPPAARTMGGHWRCQAGRDWRPLPSTEPAPVKAKKQVQQPEGEPDYIDPHSQEHREGQRLF